LVLVSACGPARRANLWPQPAHYSITSTRSKLPISVLIAQPFDSALPPALHLLVQRPGFLVVGHVDDGDKVVRQAKRLKPAVVLMEIDLIGIDGIEATRLIKTHRPEQRVLIYTNRYSDHHLFAALSAGADGFCLKSTKPKSLELALRSVASGAAWLDSQISTRVIQASVRATSPQVSKQLAAEHSQAALDLTTRELEILASVSRGMTNLEIAKSPYLSIETVKVHIKNILKKLGVSHRTHAAVIALRMGLVPPTP